MNSYIRCEQFGRGSLTGYKLANLGCRDEVLRENPSGQSVLCVPYILSLFHSGRSMVLISVFTVMVGLRNLDTIYGTPCMYNTIGDCACACCAKETFFIEDKRDKA